MFWSKIYFPHDDSVRFDLMECAITEEMVSQKALDLLAICQEMRLLGGSFTPVEMTQIRYWNEYFQNVPNLWRQVQARTKEGLTILVETENFCFVITDTYKRCYPKSSLCEV